MNKPPVFPFADEQIIATEHYARGGHPHELFRWLREHDPVRRFLPDDFPPFWAVTKHKDIVEIERQPTVFLSAPYTRLLPERIVNAVQEQLGGRRVSTDVFRSLVSMDPPDHSRYRQLVMPFFKESILKRLERRLEAIADELLNEVMEVGGEQELDLVEDVIVRHPLRMICEILGVPGEDERLILRLTKEMFAGEDSEMTRGEDDTAGLVETAMEFAAYFGKLSDQRRTQPREDLCSYIANGTIDGNPIAQREQLGYYVTLATAGHDTTRIAMTGGLEALLRRPDQLQALQAQPNRIESAVEEMIRWSTPVAQFSRTATRDYALRDEVIREGDIVGLFYASANRDEEVFHDPSEFRIDRQPNRHLAFGTGPHVCLGMALARMEMRVFLRRLLPRLVKLELTGEPTYLQASFVHGIKHMPVRIQLRA